MSPNQGHRHQQQFAGTGHPTIARAASRARAGPAAMFHSKKTLEKCYNGIIQKCIQKEPATSAFLKQLETLLCPTAWSIYIESNIDIERVLHYEHSPYRL